MTSKIIMINDLYEYAYSKQLPLLGTYNYTFMSLYNDNREQLDRMINLDYYSRRVITPISNYSEKMNSLSKSIPVAYESFIDAVSSFLLRNNYKFKTLYETEILQYDPIYNVEEHTTETITRIPDLTTTDSNNKVFGKIVDTLGNSTITSTSTESKAPYDSEEFSNQSKIVNSVDTPQITNTTDSRTDIENKTIKESGTDTTTLSRERKGNIGITSSQQLLEMQRKVAYFSFFETLINDIINYTCIRVW